MNTTYQHDELSMRTLTSESLIIHYPQNEVEELRNALLPAGSQVSFSSGKHINLTNRNREKVCYILLDGHVSYRHKENGFVISYGYTGSLIGIGSLLTGQNAGYFCAETNIKTMCIPEDKFLEIFSINNNLWKSLSYYMSYVSQRLIIRDTRLNTKNAYQTVKNLLIELSEQPDYIFHKTSASRYILERTYLARSTVMNILSQLQKGNYIEIKNGLLIKINKLPEKF